MVATLTASLVQGRLEVRQAGGFGPDAKAALRSVSLDHTWEAARSTWSYPYTPGSLQGLVDIAGALKFELLMESMLREQLGRIQAETESEWTTRRLLQKFMDDANLPVAGYNTQPVPPPWRHQQVAWHWAMRVRAMYLALKPGCISGDAVIKVNRHGKVYATKLRDLYEKWHNLSRVGWKKKGPTTAKSLMPDGILKHNLIKNVLKQGVRQTVLISLKSGKELVCTPDHEIAVQGGWCRADKLAKGSTVLTNGQIACRECGTTKKVIHYYRAKYKGLCWSCSKKGDRGGNWRGGRQIDKDGYVLVSGQYTHPRRDRHDCVREHVLVLEKKLGRFLVGDEVGHHKNGIKDDNSPDNLELSTNVEHSRHHGVEGSFQHMDGGTGGKGGEIIFVPREDTVVSVKPFGETDVYDIVMDDPGRNFVADGIIVHNCGKTRIGSDVIRGKFELGQIRSPEQFPLPERMSRAFEGEKARKLPARWCVRGGTLIVCPRVVISEWLEQLMRWQNIRGVAIVGDAEKKRYRAGLKAWVHICAYDSLESIEDNEYDGIIGDELHFIANEDSNRWNRMEVLRRSASWVLGLSGTPIPNQLQSLWAQFYWLDGGRTLGPSYEAFKRKYFVKEGRKLEETSTAESRITQALSRITMFLTLQQAFPGKAEKVHKVIRIPLTAEQAKYYEQVRKKAASDILTGTVSAVEQTTRLLKLLQICQGFVLDDERVVQQFSSAKLNELEKMLSDKGELTDQRTIVWCRFRHDITMVSQMLTRKGVAHMTWTGGISEAEETRIKTEWNNNYKQRVFVGMIQKGIGVNLHAPNCVDDKGQPARCSTTVFFGFDYKVTELEQAMDRVYRGDQVETCLYYYLLSEDLDQDDDNGNPMKPIDARIYDVLLEKLGQVARVTEGSIEYVRRLLGA